MFLISDNSIHIKMKFPFTVFEYILIYPIIQLVLKKTPVLKSLFNKFAGLHAGNLITERLQHRCFPVKVSPNLSCVLGNFV